MYCLHCGDCCNRMCPLGINPCPHVIQDDDFYFCGNYEQRPEQCYKHKFDSRFCPVGIMTLKLNHEDTREIQTRINDGWEKIKSLSKAEEKEEIRDV